MCTSALHGVRLQPCAGENPITNNRDINHCGNRISSSPPTSERPRSCPLYPPSVRASPARLLTSTLPSTLPFFAARVTAQTLEILQRPGSYEKLEALSKRMVEGVLAAAEEAGHEACGGYIRGMFGFFFNKGPVNTFDDASKSDGGGCCRAVSCRFFLILIFFLLVFGEHLILSVR